MPVMKNGVDRTEHKVEELYELSEHNSGISYTRSSCVLIGVW